MDNVNRQVMNDKCPSFYTEKIKQPKKTPMIQSLVKAFESVFRSK